MPTTAPAVIIMLKMTIGIAVQAKAFQKTVTVPRPHDCPYRDDVDPGNQLSK